MEKMNKNMEKVVKIAVALFIIALVAIIVVLLMLKYQVEGEKNMPFQLGKIMIISNAEGIQKENPEATWDLSLVQNNDIYIEINKNKNYKETEIIDKVILDNFKIISNTKAGEIVVYRPSTNENKTYEYLEEYIINDKLEYIGASESKVSNLELANQGGMILLRYSIKDIGKYISNDDTEIQHDGTLLSKIGIPTEKLKSKVSFDITIALKSGINYKGTINLELPVGDIVNQGTSNSEITNFKDVVFKRL